MNNLHPVRLLKREEIAEDVFALTFSKPENFTYESGQFILLMGASDGDQREFSLTSTPHEEHLTIATKRGKSRFKKNLLKLSIGKICTIEGPYGDFTIHSDKDIPALFFARGIGITPFISIFKQETFEKQSNKKIQFFYVNDKMQQVVFLPELRKINSVNKNFSFVPFLPSPEQFKIYEKNIPNFDKTIYYLCGSPKSVLTFKNFLLELGVNKKQIKTENFSGYKD